LVFLFSSEPSSPKALVSVLCCYYLMLFIGGVVCCAISAGEFWAIV